MYSPLFLRLLKSIIYHLTDRFKEWQIRQGCKYNGSKNHEGKRINRIMANIEVRVKLR
jgi:hypothetical protein